MKYIYRKLITFILMCTVISISIVSLNCEITFFTPEEAEDVEREWERQYEEAGYHNINSTETKSNNTSQPQQSNVEDKKNTVLKTCDHEYEDKITKEPTCSEAGEMTSTCTKCGDTYKTELAAIGKHEYESVVTKDPTCTEVGELTYTCKVCGDSYTEEITATGHSYESQISKAATCTVPGEQVYTCSLCGDTYTEEIPATGHVSGDWTITKEAGLFTPGERIIKCSVCGDTLTSEAIPSRWPITYLYAAIVVGAVLVIGIIVIKVKKGKK